MIDQLIDLDEKLLLALNGLRAPFWDYFMWIVSAKLTWAAMYATLVYILFRNFSWKAAIFFVVTITLCITFADQVSASLIRPAVARMRPSNLDNPLSEFVHILNGKRGGRYGFPSCHAANSFALAFIILLITKQKCISIFLMFWAILNSYSRIYLGVHYPGDLAAGMLVGIIGSTLIYYGSQAMLSSQKCQQLIKLRDKDKELILHPQKIEGTRSTLYIGIATIAIIAIYAALNI